MSAREKREVFSHRTRFQKFIPDFKQLPFGSIIGQDSIIGVTRMDDLRMPDELINRLTWKKNPLAIIQKDGMHGC